jgi:CO/xanthine dehydrogenase FAD-binding subunit
MRILKPKTVDEALTILGDYGPEARVLAGGTDLIPQMNIREIRPKRLVSMRSIEELSYIRDEGDELHIGPLTTHAVLAKSPQVRKRAMSLSQASAQLGSPLIRNIGTVGGNLCWASPAADTAPALLSLGADVIWRQKGREHRSRLENFFEGVNQTSLPPSALLTGIVLPATDPKSRSVYLKLGVRNAVTIAVVSVAVWASLDTDNTVRDIRIAMGSVASRPILAGTAAACLKGKVLDSAMVHEAAEKAVSEISPISDVRASAWYRKEMTALFTRRALQVVGGVRES